MTSKGAKLVQFNGRRQEMYFPCKYWALRAQQCGKYRINLSPGHRWLYPRYFLDTLWLGVRDTESGEEWTGRTDNKLAVKVGVCERESVCVCVCVRDTESGEEWTGRTDNKLAVKVCVFCVCFFTFVF